MIERDSHHTDGGTTTAPTLELPESIEEAIVEDARSAVPEECCGVFGGGFDTNRSRVDSRYPTRNVAAEPRREYRIDPEEQLAVFEELEDRGEEIVGFYHSHPRGPHEPSETDVAGAAWPDRSYVIVSLEGDHGEEVIGSWRWRDNDHDHDDDSGQFVSETIERP
ncbi:desampylase [Natronosalvus vescus]|uniref:desampylase n=1 Tax=Natronosalvus vescus TaxID=2953881 RepID=UPI00209112A9|nr:desampylase [Natronosalvus vescus]